MLKNTDNNFSALLPDSIREDSVIQGLQEAFAAEYSRLVADIPAVLPWENLDNQTEPVLSLMAYDVNPLLWNKNWSDEIKREVLRNSLRWRMIHGTPACVEEFASTVLDAAAVVIPWWIYDGEPGCFKVNVEFSSHGYTEEALESAYHAIMRAKNTRSHLDAIDLELASRGLVFWGACVLVEESITIRPYVPSEINASFEAHIASATDVMETIIVRQPS
jgi:phage tail P2-like protein